MPWCAATRSLTHDRFLQRAPLCHDQTCPLRAGLLQICRNVWYVERCIEFILKSEDLRPGSFVSLYKYILNALPLLCQPIESHPFIPDDEEDIALDPPRPIGKRVRQLRLSVSGRAHHEWTRKRTKAWFSVVAGAVAGGVAIMFERRSRRVTIGQQVFVRSVKPAIALTMWCLPFDA